MDEERNYITLIFPKSDKELRLKFKTDFYTVSPRYWDSSGMKFDNDQRLFYGSIPGTEIPSALIGTGLYIDDAFFEDPRVNSFIEETLSKFPIQVKEDYEHDLAFSFAGEDREIVELIAIEIKKNDVNIFYDNFYKAELVGKDLSDYFKEKYGNKSKYIVIFISKYYPQKDWTNFEFEIAREEAQHRKEEFILPVRLDNTIIQGLKRTIGYIDFQKEGIKGTVKTLLEKINLPYKVQFKETEEIKKITKNYIKLGNNNSEPKIKEVNTNFMKEIPYGIDKNDERINVLKELIKNLIIQHYIPPFNHNTNRIIYQLTEILSKYSDSYFNEYIGSGRPNYRKLIRLFFNCNLDEFKEKIHRKEIENYNIERTSFMRAGDLALIFSDRYEKPLRTHNELVDSIRKDYNHEILQYRYVREDYNHNKFNNALKILRKDYNLINVDKEYTGSVSDAKWKIVDISRIKQFAKKYSINYYLRQLDEY